jgi:competence protein ComEA
MSDTSLSSRLLSQTGAVLIGLLLAGVLFLVISQPRGTPVELLPAATPAPIRIHVAGAVRSPGVYDLLPESIVRDAIESAGGITEDAEMDNLNLAAGLVDGQRVFVPIAGQREIALDSSSELVPINTAGAPQLEQLPGIGPVLAQSIVSYRERYGPFQRLEDLLEVEGIGPAKLEAIRDLVIVP